VPDGEKPVVRARSAAHGVINACSHGWTAVDHARQCAGLSLFLAENNLAATMKGMFLAFLAQSEKHLTGIALSHKFSFPAFPVCTYLEPDDVLGRSFFWRGCSHILKFFETANLLYLANESTT
jgi:hypothetical protein